MGRNRGLSLFVGGRSLACVRGLRRSISKEGLVQEGSPRIPITRTCFRPMSGTMIFKVNCSIEWHDDFW